MPITIARPDLTGRQPALHGFIVRCLFAASAQTARRTMIEACKAEILWSDIDWSRLTGHSRLHDYRDGPHPAETYRLPHEHAASRVLNAWGHLHPTEVRIRHTLAILRGQLRTAALIPEWSARADATREHLRLIVGDRARQSKAFFAAVANYRRLRAVADTDRQVSELMGHDVRAVTQCLREART